MDIYEHIDFLRAKYTQYRFVLKPHPALFKALLSGSGLLSNWQISFNLEY